MPILTTLLQGLNGIIGGVNGNMGIQVLGSVAINFGSSSIVTVYSPPLNSNAHIVVTDCLVRMPDGPPVPTISGYPLQVLVRLQSSQISAVALNPNGQAQPDMPCYAYGDLRGALPLGINSTITASMAIASPQSKMGYVDVIGYGAST